MRRIRGRGGGAEGLARSLLLSGPMTTIKPEIVKALVTLQARLVDAVLALELPDLEEGEVLSGGPPPYRRLDCDGRALAYIRPRPRKRAVRVDITGLWRAPRSSPIATPNAGGAASLLVGNEGDLHDAVRFILATVEGTRRAEARALERQA